ncbi:MAG: hypothetical protein WBA74_19740, partial [Cyclobacteriaceae bacterium]
MKSQRGVLLLLILVAVAGCNDQPSGADQHTLSIDSGKGKFILAEEKEDTLFINTRSSVNYYDAPGGKSLGEFYENYQLTPVSQFIPQDSGSSAKWHGVLLYNDTVYLSGQNVSPNKPAIAEESSATPTRNSLKIYELSSYSVDNRNYNSMVTLTD